jgi:glucose-6-phosphate isomerase
MSALPRSTAWQALAANRPTIDAVSMRARFAEDPQRFARMSGEACGLFVDWLKHRATDETLALLLTLARQQDVEG